MIIFTSFSKKNFYYRVQISKFIFDSGNIPVNPFMNFDYFLSDTVDRDYIRQANNELIRRCEELWVFGEISNGVAAEIELCHELGIYVKYFKIVDSREIKEIKLSEIVYEREEDV
jgi:hypothetical protein